MNGNIGEDLNGLHSGKLEYVGLTLFKFISMCMKVPFITMIGDPPCLLCGRDVGNKRLLLSQAHN